jgi:hypothetical protein
MSENAEPTTSCPSTSCAEGSRANPSATPASERVTPTNAGSGLSSTGLFASLDPDGCWRKTSQGCCQLMLDGSMEEFSETWPRAGTMRSGTAYRRPPLVPRTGATGFGFLPTHSIPTPTGSDYIERTPTRTDKASKFNPETNKAVSLDRWVRLWPTPKATEWKGASGPGKGGHGGLYLTGAVKLWPTPVEQDSRAAATPAQLAHRDWQRDNRPKGAPSSLTLEACGDVPSGQLNPTWVEWLMGFPCGYSDLEGSATPSCPKLRNGSDGES